MHLESMSTKRCMFCQGDVSGGKRAKEHIIPRHLQKEFSILKKKLSHSQFKTVDGEFSGGHISKVPAERTLTFSSFLAGQVCADCNGGWMSQLETRVQPFIYDLIRGLKPIEALSKEEAETLSIWALKTSVALSQSVGALEHHTPKHHAYDLYSTAGSRLPGNVIVLAKIGSTSNFLWSLCPIWVVQTARDVNSNEFIEQYRNTYKIFIQLGELMLLSCHWPDSSVIYTRESWKPHVIGSTGHYETSDVDSREIFADECEQFLMAVGAIL